MSANYWESTQRRYWQFTKEQLASMRQKLEEDNADLVRMFPLPQQRHLNIYFNQREPLSPRGTASPSSPARRHPTNACLACRVDQIGEAPHDPAAVYGDCPSLHEALLFEGRDPPNESLPRHCHVHIPRLQNGGVATAHPPHCDGSAADVAGSRRHRYIQARRVRVLPY
ncbi:RNA polymerase II holoenzyme cyclin-like subunit [Ilyonectria robusta]